MKRSSQIILHIGILLSLLMLEAACLIVGCSLKGIPTVRIPVFPLAAAVCLLYLCNEWLSVKNPPVNLLLTANAIFCALGAALGIHLIQIQPGNMTILFLRILLPVSLILCGACFTWMPRELPSLIVAFDSLIGFFLLYLFLELTGVFVPDGKLEFDFLLTIGLVMMAMVMIRTSSESGTSGFPLRGILPVLLLILGCLLLALAFSLLISGQVRSAASFFAMLLKHLVLGFFWIMGLLSDLLEKLFGWLMKVLPDAETMPADLGLPAAVPENLPALKKSSFTVPAAALAAVFLVLVLLGLIWLFRRMRGKRLRKKSTRKTSGHIERSWHNPISFPKLLQSVLTNIHFHIRLFRRRKTPSVLAFRIEQYGRRHHMPRQMQESVPAYLKRMAKVSGEPGISEALCTLADLVQQEYYANVHTVVPRELYRLLRSFF